LWPPPQTVDTPFQIAWEYITLAWAKDASGALITKMTADDDEPILDSQAIVLDVKWRFLEAKGVRRTHAQRRPALRALSALPVERS
jgi:hypothetical protein